jgi:hypothetical protein
MQQVNVRIAATEPGGESVLQQLGLHSRATAKHESGCCITVCNTKLGTVSLHLMSSCMQKGIRHIPPTTPHVCLHANGHQTHPHLTAPCPFALKKDIKQQHLISVCMHRDLTTVCIKTDIEGIHTSPVSKQDTSKNQKQCTSPNNYTFYRI